MINFWKLTCETVKKQRDQYKTENEKIRDQFDYMNQSYMKLYEKNEKLSEQYNKMLEERNSLIDDLPWYKAKVSRLEQIRDIKDSALKGADIKIETLEQRISKLVSENTKLQNDLFSEQLIQDEADDKIKKLERENEKLRKAHYNGWKQKDEVINNLISNIKSKDNLLSEISQHIGNKPSSSTYKYFRAKLDGIGIKEGE